MAMKRNQSTILKLVYSLVFATAVWGCTDDFSKINTNEKQITTDAIAKDVLLQGQVFAQAQYATMYADPYYFQYAQNWCADLYVQYFALTTPDAEADRYDFTDSW